MCYVIVCNIPASFRSRDLRFHFSTFVERNFFDYFHFRHRPEGQLKTVCACGTDKASTSGQHYHLTATSKSTCAVVKLSTGNADRFKSCYDGRDWSTESGENYPGKCVIIPIIVVPDGCSEPREAGSDPTASSSSVNYIDESYLLSLPELNPPSVMRNGNVGTKTQDFLKLIRTCRLPPSLIKTLGLSFRGSRARRIYSEVPPPCTIGPGIRLSEPGDVDHRRLYDRLNSASASTAPGAAAGDCHDDYEEDDSLQEWERHEQLHDDVTSQDRTKPKLFEEDVEVVWDKGSSGLVMYTDDFYWDQMKGRDCDERWADDWDVDMEIYTDPSGGDKSARDCLAMHREHRARKGDIQLDSVFARPNPCQKRKKSSPMCRNADDADDKCADDALGSFESHTTGIGSRLMKAYGWIPGTGLGRGMSGSSLPLETDGQNPRSRKGFGYRGEKLQRYNLKRSKKEEHIIASIYDQRTRQPDLNREGESLFVRPELPPNKLLDS